MNTLHRAALTGSLLLLAGCATPQPYLATHASAGQLAEIHGLHVISVIDQDKLEAQHNSLYVNAVPLGAVAPAVIIGAALGSAIVSAEAAHEAKVFATTHVAPLQATLAGYDGRAAIRQTLQAGLADLPVRKDDWKTVDAKTADAALLPASAAPGAAWLVLRTHYSMTPDFAGLQVITKADLYIDDGSANWRTKPAYKNDFTYQSPLLEMPAKTDAVRKQLADAENARYAKLDVDAQIAKSNATDPYDPANAALRETIHDEQWKHESKLKQINSPIWNADARASHFVQQWQADAATSLKGYVSEGGTQTARMLALDLTQKTPAANATHTWSTVYRDDQRTIQDAPDGTVHSVANGDVNHGAIGVSTTTYINATPVR